MSETALRQENTAATELPARDERVEATAGEHSSKPLPSGT